MYVFVSGSRSIRTLPTTATVSLDRIMTRGFTVLVGDCYGVDDMVQRYLAGRQYAHVLVYHIGDRPRHNQGFRTVRVGGSRQTDKDAAMARAADYGLAIWDGVSAGTRKNIERVALTKVIRA